jgi:glycerol-3-phosphate dehydrogenase
VRDGTHWRVTLRDAVSGRRETIAAHGLVNAAGPWVEEVLHKALPAAARGRVRLVEGAHIVVAKLFDHDRAYLFQRPDGRVVFAIPYEGKFTLIGTTDRDYVGDPAAASATADEIAYLCDTANAAFAASIGPSDVVWSYSGVRPLFDDGAGEARAASRDYMLELDAGEGAPLLTIVGGKITIYRKMAEAVLDRILPHLPKRAGLDAGWTGKTPLPGGDFGAQGAGELTARLSRDFPFLGEAWSRRLVRAYGTRAWTVLGEAKSAADLGEQFGATLTEAEVRYLIEREWARSPEDILWRSREGGIGGMDAACIRRGRIGRRITVYSAASLSGVRVRLMAAMVSASASPSGSFTAASRACSKASANCARDSFPERPGSTTSAMMRFQLARPRL